MRFMIYDLKSMGQGPALRFSLAFNSKGEIVLHWTNKAGIRVWRILSGNRGKKPSKANLERMSNFRRWLFDARQGMEGYTQQPEQSNLS